MAPDPLELYTWDLRGVLHLRNVLAPSTVTLAIGGAFIFAIPRLLCSEHH
jgi:hypothetical protein